MNTTTVTVYTTPACVQCRATERALDKAGIAFTKVDVTEDPAAHEYVLSLGYTQAPVVVINENTHWAGFRPDLLAQHAASVAA